MKKVATFGEIMLRISPINKGERVTQADSFRIEPGGSESNVAIALSNLGFSTTFLTRLPNNSLTDKIIQYLRQFNVDSSKIKRCGDKLGMYWTENGIGPRNSNVIYDRDHTAFSEIRLNDFNWEEICKDLDWFHFSGISPAVSENVYKVLRYFTSNIKVPYSVDLNFRTKLWNWVNKDSLQIKSIMQDLCSGATLIAGNESDFQNIFGLSQENNNISFDKIANECFQIFPELKYISISNRKSISASTNTWNGFLFVRNEKQKKYVGLEYKIETIEDRVGTGDSFVSGIIFGLLTEKGYSFQEIIDFATTLSALNHTTIGDASRFSIEEVWKTMENKGTGRINR